ncbi:Zinc finger BED domain-containing protein DAYSLEEPER [Senna tora]|uniref:Zinc finger BED domain-containing protein DAYSLEEPER n=1 Tax=Senna tora TaxID=362788 RepID=A0A834SR91_9FABA|nr:Zinc finger BED domain-containing protein DAYSLEEPER [Senna tora]
MLHPVLGTNKGLHCLWSQGTPTSKSVRPISDNRVPPGDSSVFMWPPLPSSAYAGPANKGILTGNRTCQIQLQFPNFMKECNSSGMICCGKNVCCIKNGFQVCAEGLNQPPILHCRCSLVIRIRSSSHWEPEAAASAPRTFPHVCCNTISLDGVKGHHIELGLQILDKRNKSWLLDHVKGCHPHFPFHVEYTGLIDSAAGCEEELGRSPWQCAHALLHPALTVSMVKCSQTIDFFFLRLFGCVSGLIMMRHHFRVKQLMIGYWLRMGRVIVGQCFKMGHMIIKYWFGFSGMTVMQCELITVKIFRMVELIVRMRNGIGFRHDNITCWAAFRIEPPHCWSVLKYICALPGRGTPNKYNKSRSAGLPDKYLIKDKKTTNKKPHTNQSQNWHNCLIAGLCLRHNCLVRLCFRIGQIIVALRGDLFVFFKGSHFVLKYISALPDRRK